MRERVRLALAACFYYSGLVYLAHWWIRRFRPSLIILNYHRATDVMLRHQMRYLRKHYRVMHLDEALEAFFAPGRKSHMADRRLPLVLTFDDGYHDNYSSAFAWATELRVPITIFLIPGYVESGSRFWWLEGKRLATYTPTKDVTLEDQTYDLERSEERVALAKTIDTRVRFAPSVAVREEQLDHMRTVLAITPQSPVEQVDREALPLTWAEVKEMEQSGWVSFGAHTMHHPVLAYLQDPEEVRREVAECRQVLEGHLGHPVLSFAYPIGKLEHIGTHGVQAVKDAGYRWAVTTIEDVNTYQTDHYLLRRLPGDITQHWLIMAAELVGLLGLSRRRRKSRERRSR